MAVSGLGPPAGRGKLRARLVRRRGAELPRVSTKRYAGVRRKVRRIPVGGPVASDAIGYSDVGRICHFGIDRQRPDVIIATGGNWQGETLRGRFRLVRLAVWRGPGVLK
jgi:hypothetical protein